MAETRQRTLLKERWIDENYVRARNYQYISVRECDWNRRVTLRSLSLSLSLPISLSLSVSNAFFVFFPLSRQVTSDPAIKAFIEGLDPDAFVSRLDVRDAFYGGRVETFSLFQEAAEDEAIR